MDLLGGIRNFLAIVDYKGFSAAARHLSIPTSALSKQLTSLEMHFGKKLIKRTTRRLELTREGKIFYIHARKIVLQLQCAEQALRTTQNEIQGKIKIAAPNCMARSVLIDPLKKLLSQYPQLKIEIINDPSPALVSDGIADIAISRIEINDAQLIKKLLMKMQRGIFASPHYLKKYGAPTAVAEFKNHNCLFHSAIAPELQWTFSNDKTFISPGNFSSDMYADLVSAAVSGIGLLCISKSLVQEEIDKKELVALQLDQKPESANIFIYYKPVLASHCTAAVADFFIKYFSKENKGKSLIT